MYSRSIRIAENNVKSYIKDDGEPTPRLESYRIKQKKSGFLVGNLWYKKGAVHGYEDTPVRRMPCCVGRLGCL